MRMIALVLCWVTLYALFVPHAFGQALNRTQTDITCPATGTSIEVLPLNAKRLAWVLLNTGSATIRFGYIATGTAALTATNSQQILSNGTYSESFPTVWNGRIVCMSTTGATMLISITEIRR